jgi:hypothetical protein
MSSWLITIPHLLKRNATHNNLWRNPAHFRQQGLAVNTATDEPSLENMKGKIMTLATNTDEPTVEAVAEEFVKEHNSLEIVEELVKYSNEVDRLRSQLEYERGRNTAFSVKLEQVKEFITEHVRDKDSASVEELKDLATQLDLILTKEVRVQFTVEYDLTIELDLDQEVSETDFSVSMSYDGVGELTNESEDWSAIEIEDEE